MYNCPGALESAVGVEAVDDIDSAMFACGLFHHCGGGVFPGLVGSALQSANIRRGTSAQMTNLHAYAGGVVSEVP